MTETNTKINDDIIARVESVYDDAVMFCLMRKTFNSADLCKVFDLEPIASEELITTMLINGVIGDVSDDGEYKISDKYNHSDYLLSEELKKEKEDLKSARKPLKIGKFLGVIAFIVFFVTAYFAFREPMSLFIIVPLCVLVGAGVDKVGAVTASIGVIVICVVSLFWVNSKAPIFGERYENKLAIEKYKDAERREKIEEMNQVSFGEKRLKNSLKDPSSAEIRNSRLGKSGVICGEVNAKNSFGAFTGYKKFIQIGTTTLMEDGSSEFSKEWSDMCR